MTDSTGTDLDALQRQTDEGAQELRPEHELVITGGPWPELEERIKALKARAAELGRDPSAIEIAPQFSLTIAKTAEEAEKRYMASGLVAHRKSLAYTGRDLSKQVVANLVGSPDLIREKVEGLRKIGVDHACALMIPADSIAEFEDQVEWFAKTVM